MSWWLWSCQCGLGSPWGHSYCSVHTPVCPVVHPSLPSLCGPVPPVVLRGPVNPFPTRPKWAPQMAAGDQRACLMGLQKRGAEPLCAGREPADHRPPPPSLPRGRVERGSAGQMEAPPVHRVCTHDSGGGAGCFSRKGPGEAAWPARHITCPHREDTGKADHISNYRGRRWQDLLAALTSQLPVRAERVPRGRAVA